MKTYTAAFALAALLAAPVSAGDGEKVVAWRLPKGAHQPEIVVDSRGTVHAVYFRAGPRVKGKGRLPIGNLFYVYRDQQAEGWSEPQRVNSEDRTATGFSFPQIALGEGGRVHIAWVTMNPPAQWYTRTDSKGEAFEKQRNLLSRSAKGIENGPALLADGEGDVYVIWHEGKFKEEPKRSVVMRRSSNDGKKFGRQRRISPRGAGVCACCGLAARLDPDGKLFVCFRAAGKKIHRDMTLLTSTDGGKSFDDELVDPWEFQACPTSLTDFSGAPNAGTVLVWETKGRIYFAKVDDMDHPTQLPEGAGKMQKHPSIAINAAGEVLVTWAEVGPGRRLAWQLFDADGEPTEDKVQRNVPLPRGGKATVAVLPDGTFVLVL